LLYTGSFFRDNIKIVVDFQENKGNVVKKGIHPEMFDVKVTCTCGATFDMRSTVSNIKPTLCSKCHPFYTGEQRFVDTMGRIERFEKKFKKFKKGNKSSK